MSNIVLKATIIEVGQWIKPESMPEISKEQYIFIDFWATWCGPCIKAMDHVEELSKISGNKVVYISLSNENADVVRNFFKKREAKTIIAVDYKQVTFKKFNVESLPFAILMSPDGSIIWKGAPSSMSFSKIKQLTSGTNQKSVPIKSKIVTHKADHVKSSYQSSKTYEFEGLRIELEKYDIPIPLNISSDMHSTTISGSINQVVASLLDINLSQISNEANRELYIRAKFLSPLHEEYKLKYLDFILSHYKLELNKTNEYVITYLLEVLEPSSLWSKDIYNWDEGMNEPLYLVGDDLIQADNATVAEIMAKIAEITGKNIVVVSAPEDKYDWNLILPFEDMIFQLEDEYGIHMEETQYMVEKFEIISK